MYGDRWQQWQPLTDVERADILRAEIGYALAEDKIGLERFRDRYAPKMAGTPDARAFEIASAPFGSTGEDFKDIAHAAAAEDTLDDFLRDMRRALPGIRRQSGLGARGGAGQNAGCAGAAGWDARTLRRRALLRTADVARPRELHNAGFGLIPPSRMPDRLQPDARRCDRFAPVTLLG